MKHKIAIIGANEFQNPLILKAKALGYDTYVFAWKSGDIGEYTADHFIPISIIEKELIWDFCKENGIEACVSIGSDLATHTVNFIQRRLGKPCNPFSADLVSTNKFEMRKAFLNCGIATPRFVKTNSSFRFEEISDFGYPLIVKPVDRSGSRGIFKVNSKDELNAAIKSACAQSFSDQAIIEEFIEGNEYSCESISFMGQHTALQFTKKYTTGAPHFIETGHAEPSDIPAEFQDKIKKQIYAALTALHVEFGASHAEFKVDDKWNAHIIEIGARMGGDCIGSDLVPLSTGFDFMRMVIDIAMGSEPDFSLICHPKKTFIKFILNYDDFLEYKKAAEDNSVSIIRASIGDNFSKEVSDSSSRHGFYIFQQKE